MALWQLWQTASEEPTSVATMADGIGGAMRRKTEMGSIMPEHELNDDEKAAGHAPRRCTDVMCLLVFLGALAYTGHIMQYAFANGDTRRLYHGFNFQGELCGVDTAVADRPYLFWCAKPHGVGPSGTPASLDMDHPICVKTCPTSDEISNKCFQSRDATTGTTDAQTGTFTELVTYTFDVVPAYKTTVLGARYCFPADPLLAQQAQKALEQMPMTNLLTHMEQILVARDVLIAAAGLAFILGYVYLKALDTLAGPLVYFCLLLSAVGPIAAGVVCICRAKQGGFDKAPYSGDVNVDLGIGIAATTFGVIVALISCCCRKSIQLAIGCVEAACDCMFDMPSLLLEPLFNIVFRACTIIAMLSGLALLLSCGDVRKYELTQMLPGGITRNFVYDDLEYYYIAFYIFMTIWVLELLTATAQFVLAHSTQIWYFKEYSSDGTKKLPQLLILRGYYVGWTYHLGTLATGSFIISALRIVRIVLGLLAREANKSGNAVVKSVASCCQCCLACFESFLRFMNKNAYMSVAVDSYPFCKAAKKAMSVIAGEAVAGLVLNGACWIFQLAGVLSITSAGTFLIYITLISVDAFANPTSARFVEDPVLVSGVGSVIVFLVAVAFMVVFDTVADTILFCWASDKQYRAEHPLERQMTSKKLAPPRLQAILESAEEHAKLF